MNYRGYTIEPETDPWLLKYGFLYFIGSGDDKKSFTCAFDAKDFVDEEIMASITPYKVKTKGPFPIGGVPQLNITKFTWLSEAVPFAVKHNGELTTTFNCP